jgi:hypothetical protein
MLEGGGKLLRGLARPGMGLSQPGPIPSPNSSSGDGARTDAVYMTVILPFEFCRPFFLLASVRYAHQHRAVPR